MIIKEEDWINVTNYLILQIREYCAKKSIDNEDFAKKLGISLRALARLYSKKTHTNEVRNNRLLSSLEFLHTLAEALEMNPVRMFRDMSIHANFNDEKSIEKNHGKITDEIRLSKFMHDDILQIFNSQLNKKKLFEKIKNYINLSIILIFVKQDTIKKIINLIEKDPFDKIKNSDKEKITFNLKSIQNELCK